VKRRYVRPDGELSDETVVVVRGGGLDSEILAQDAQRAHDVYGTYAISVFVTVDELAQEPPLVRFASITLMTVGEIRPQGCCSARVDADRLHYSIDFDDLDTGVEALVRCEHRTIVNPYHES